MPIAAQRLSAQGLSEPRFDTPEAVVSHLGAVQAQDWYGSLWAVGSRLRDGTEADIEAAIAQRRIVRTWPMRGTLHFVAPGDARWMLQLLAPRVIAADRARIERDFGLDDATLARSRKAVENALRDGAPMARSDLYAAIDAAGIASERMRGLHILGWLAMQGAICCGPRAGKQPTFVLMDAWIPPTAAKAREEALRALALRYFRSHGPATVQDLAWWAGLTVKDAQSAAVLAADALQVVEIDGKRYLRDAAADNAAPTKALQLIAPFDEYLVGYKERSAAVDPRYARQVTGINGLVNAGILVGGKVVGTWKRVLQQNTVALAMSPFRPLTRGEQAQFKRAARRYAAYLNVPLAS